MNADDLRAALANLDLTQADLARLVKVTARAANLWATGDREVPGPVSAYLALLLSLPRALQAQELARLEERKVETMEGLYALGFSGTADSGFGALVFMAGRIFGSDVGDVQYDGTYEPSVSQPGHIDLKLKLTVPPGTELVQGVPAQPMEYRFDLAVTVPSRGGEAVVQTPFGPVTAQLRYLRAVPSELAA